MYKLENILMLINQIFRIIVRINYTTKLKIEY